VSASKPVTSTVSEIKPGAATVTKFTDAATGLKQIEITVNNPAQNVQITVTKYDSKPAAVSVSKTGTVQYVQISTQNLANKMTGAKVQFQVEKSKISNKDNVVISKFDETAKKWNDLATDYASEDSKFYYYDVEVSSFSYFAISETALVAGNDAGTNGASGTTGGLMWLWIVLAVVVIALVVWAVMRKK
jgi:PGF-pre-PGF domain-containing protein